MGGCHSNTYNPPCPNCTPLGRKRLAYMGSSEWRHGQIVCSNACGIRLDQRIENGMIDNPAPSNLWGASGSDAKEDRLRIRIKQLSARLKRRLR